ncbi:MAG: HEAT repeat domain-containing protein [Candidatus Bipolaricaulia bacterium]
MLLAQRRWLTALLGLSLLATTLIASIEGRADIRHRPSGEQRAAIETRALDVLETVALDADESEPTRLNAVRALLDFGDADAVPTLTRVLLSTPSPTVRRAVADGLVRFRGPRVTAALRTAARNDAIARIRWRAGLTLIRRGVEYRDLLEQLLAEDATLTAAAVDLQQAEVVAHLPASARAIAREALRHRLGGLDAFNDVEQAAILKALGQLDAANATSRIVDVLEDRSEDAFIRGAAASALGRLESEKAVPSLLQALNAGEVGLQSAVIRALGRIGPARAQRPLERLLASSGAAEVRAAAAQALSAYGSDAIPQLDETLDNDGSLDVRKAALASLTAIGGPKATRAVSEFARSDFLRTCDPMACGSLAFETFEALVELGRSQAAIDGFRAALDGLRPKLPLLFAFMGDALIDVATVMLDAQPDELSLFIDDDNAFVQATGLFAWTRVADGVEAREVFGRFVDPNQPRLVRRAAMEGLVAHALPRDLPVYLKGVRSDDDLTRAAAYEGLARIGGLRALEAFKQGLAAERSSVRIQAAGAALGWANLYEVRENFTDPVF